MASAKFLEEALSTDVDESAVSAIVGSLEDQLSTSTPAILQPQNISNSPHLNNNNNITTTNASAISNGGNKQQQFLQHATIPNGGEPPPQPTTTSQFITSTGMPKDGIKLIYPQQQQQQQQPRFPNGTISTATTKQLVTLKTSVGSGQQGLVSVGTATASMPTVVSSMTLGAKPLNNVTSVTNATNAVGATLVGGQQTMVSTAQGAGTPNVLPTNVQIVNVRPQGQPQGQKTTTVPPRVVLGGPHMIGARPGQSITLQSLQQLQPGQQGHLLLKTENGQYQLLRVGPAPPQQQAGAHLQQSSAGTITTQTQGTVSGPQQTTYRLQTVPAGSTTIATSLTSTTVTQNANIITNVSNTSTPAVTPGTPIVTQTTPKQSLDNTKEKCRKFLANLLELSSREPKNVEKNVRTLIQELIDTKVEPEEFCDRLERLLNASPQPCLIGFLKKSLPLLRLSLVMKEMVIDGIKPPPSHVVFSVANTPTVTTVVQGMRQQSPAQIRLMAPQAGTVVRPAVQARMATPTTIRGQAPRMITAAQLRPQFQTNNVIVPTSQPPALHPVSGAPPLFPTSATPVRVQCVKSQIQQIRQPLQQHQQQQPIIQTISQIPQIRPTNITPVRTTTPKQVAKPSVPSITTKQQTSQKKFVTTVASTASSSSAAYVPDDDINDVAAMGGVNLAEETQRILGSTEFVGQQIRSCKDELFLQSGPLQNRLRQITAKEGLEEASGDVVAIVSHATQELLKNLVEKLALITAHRIEIVKTDSRYEVTQDVRGQLKFLEELDRAERKRHDEQERELLLRAAKSRSKNEDPEQAKLKAKAKEMQRAEMEELRQREANLTALQAIGPRKKPRLDNDSGTGSTQVEAVCSCFYLTLIFLSIPSTLSINGNDENRPYEFGFSIENQQHRHEAKDAEGLVNGEFGFITGDGVYHVTVYATDKDGKFIIKSMESYKVSPPLDGSPDLSGIPIEYSITDLQNRVKSKITTPAPLPPRPVTQLQVAQKPVISIDAKPVRLTTSRPVSKTDPPKIEFTTLRPLNVASCGGCSIPSTTRVPFGKPNQFQFQTPEFQNPGVELPLEPGTKPGYETGSVDSYQEPLIRPNPGVNVISTEVLQPPNQGIQPGYSPRPNEIDSPVNQGTQPGYAPRPNEIDNPVNQPIDNPSYENLSNPGKNPISSPVNSTNSPVNQPIYNPSYENLPKPGENPFSSPVNSPNRPVNQPIYNPSYENLPNPGKNPISSPVNSPNNPVNPVDPPVSTGTGNIGASQSKPPKPATSLSQQPKPASNNIPPTKPRPSHEITFFPGLIHAPEDPQQEQIPITGNLPPGITVGDMTELLYRFNYSVGFHGHYETGYRSGVRIGGYYINYRDGYSRIVEYVADENGYRPKTSLVYLGFDSPDIPKEETEKEFGLKGQVFEWFSL